MCQIAFITKDYYLYTSSDMAYSVLLTYCYQGTITKTDRYGYLYGSTVE